MDISEIEKLLDEAEKEAENNEERLTHKEVFSKVRDKVNKKLGR